MRFLSAASGFAAGHMLRATVDEQAGARLWVPIVRGGDTQYFNPVTNAMADALPSGGRAAPAVAFAQTGDKAAEEAGVAGEATNTDLGDVETSTKKACYPHCTWNCTQPVCNQDCVPDCEQPRCQTRCPRPDYSQCKIDCQTPHCSVFCPKDSCQDSEGENCSSPKCSTRCARPVCYLKCQDNLPCKNICHPPRCTWNCRNPSECAKPECRLVCEKAKGCAQNYELPALSPAYTVQQSFAAEKAHWVVYGWGKCGIECGKSVQTRKVICSTGEDHECAFSPKPPTQQDCEDYTKCNAWRTSEWTACDQQCGRGHRTRSVWCSHKDANECLGEKPHDREKCVDHGEHCSRCEVELFGGRSFSGWHATFSVGKYETDDLVGRGADCEETSSIRVKGLCCRAKVYQYGDFNRRNKGWKVTLPEGEYDTDELADRGIEDNDVSSMKVYVDSHCQAHGVARKSED